MEFSDTASLMLLISAFISISLLALVVAMFKKTYFKDLDKSFESPLCDSVQDLNNAIEAQNSRKNNQKQDNKTK